jgi:4-cresol dehydrogenase (hydroxylating)
MDSSGAELPANISAFAEAARAVLGAAYVDFSPATVAGLASSTAPWTIAPAGVVRPADTAQVAEVLRQAARHGVALSTISTGKNWGYGDRMPATAGQVVLDLGRMNRIIEVNEELAYAVVEPGVTQGQLFQYLQERGLKLWMDCTGAGPDAGIIGNVMERGFGHTPLGDRFRAVSGLEVVLADGTVFHTGFSALSGAQVGHLYPYGLGPVLDGLFSQSNLGVVTRMGIWLMPTPPAFAAAVAFIDEEDALGPVMDRLRPLRLDGTLPSVVHVGNDLRMASGQMGFPGAGTHLTPSERQELRRRLKLSPWALSAGLYGSRRQVAAAASRLKTTLKGLPVRIKVVPDRLLAVGQQVAAGLGRVGMGAGLQRLMADASAAVGLLKGVPTRHFLKGAYWRHQGQASGHDPAADGCGLLWFAPVAPHRGSDICRAADLISREMTAHGFDPLMTISMLNGRAAALVTTIAFDATDSNAKSQAQECHQALWRRGIRPIGPPAETFTGSRQHRQVIGKRCKN